MSATRTTTVPPETPAATPPAPRRVRPPRWLDLRLVLGVLLVLGSVLVGARVVGAADATVPVWAAAGDLAPGTVVDEADLVAVDVRLDDAAGAYLATSTRPGGRTLARAVGAGELLPRSALEEPARLVQVALPVQAGFVPPGLDRGQVVDVYAVADPAAGAVAAGAPGVSLVVGLAPVQAVSGRSEGVLSTATTTVQVVVSVAEDDAAAVLAAIGGRPLVVVVHDSVDAGEGAPPAVGAAAAPTAGATSRAPATGGAAARSGTSAAPSTAPSTARSTGGGSARTGSPTTAPAASASPARTGTSAPASTTRPAG
ncbi:SAF domain-containing protein [Geodermatophilus marinus]|uniref:SAF domain-containing protein n=1 Tax=Geodermatophilus sp. LHW52908 TaxID=2303986 RepID=UPI000E3BF5C7|nr:SAF domain-containing protein [Geodermatophilus sp. LHW52908]RFU21797.1 flagellar biosynthesis protein FlgA [Geodermatophilus sp. LHW52908]